MSLNDIFGPLFGPAEVGLVISIVGLIVCVVWAIAAAAQPGDTADGERE